MRKYMADKLLLMTAHHKEDPFIPISQKLFFPIQVGKELSEIDLKINSDNQGDSISNKNKTFCELTAYYYAWKNRDEEYIGLMHYRRIFSSRKYLLHNFTAKIKYLIMNVIYCFTTPNIHQGYSNLIFTNDIEKVQQISTEFKAYITRHIEKYDVFVPKRAHFKFLTLEQNYKINHYYEDWLLFSELIETYYPFLNQSLYDISQSRHGYFYNMFIMKRAYFDEYMQILFDLLFKMENKVDLSNRSNFQSRLFGFLAERFLNIYLDYLKRTKDISIKELNAVFIDI